MRTIIIFLLLSFSFYVYAADTCGIAGTYALTGWEPGVKQTAKPSYSGTVQVTQDKGFYRFEGSADGSVFYGKGLTNDCETFAFSFSSGDMSQSGVTLAAKDGRDLRIKWAYNLPDKRGEAIEFWKLMK